MLEKMREDLEPFSKCLNEAGLVKGEDEVLDEEELQKIHELEEKRLERKRNLLLDNLGLILRHKDEVVNLPRYANIDVHYVLRVDGSDVDPLAFGKRISVAGTQVVVNLKMKSLFEIWNTRPYQVCCGCGKTAFIVSFGGSRLSGESVATAYCPYCKKEIHEIKDRHFCSLAGPVQRVLERVSNEIFLRLGAKAFDKDGDSCSLERMIHELQLKEFEEASIRT